jgi:hypothetical protein
MQICMGITFLQLMAFEIHSCNVMIAPVKKLLYW